MEEEHVQINRPLGQRIAPRQGLSYQIPQWANFGYRC